MGLDEKFLDDSAANQVFLDDPLEHRRIAVPVPGALGIDDRDRAAFTNPQTVRLGSEDTSLLGQPQRLEPAFQEIPRREASILLATFRIRLIAAKKNVPARDRHADGCGNLALRIAHVWLLAPSPKPLHAEGVRIP